MTTPPKTKADHWRKACKCRGTTATRGAVRLDQAPTQDGKGVRFSVSLPAGPVCDGCNTPWQRVTA